MALAKEISAEQYVRGGTKAKHGDIPYIATIHHGHCQGVILNQYSVLMNSICTAPCHNSNCKIMVGLTELQPENGRHKYRMESMQFNTYCNISYFTNWVF